MAREASDECRSTNDKGNSKSEAQLNSDFELPSFLRHSDFDIRHSIDQHPTLQIARSPHPGNWLGLSPRSTMLQPSMTVSPMSSAAASRASSAVPGFSQTSSGSSTAISS